MNILIYPHGPLALNDGGITVQYYLAKLLEENGVNVRIHPVYGSVENNIFDKYYNNEFDLNDCFVIYCEGIIGNPLNSKKIIRWMLSPLGKNVDYYYLNTWSKDELVYYFNSESRFTDNKIYKLLTTLYINPDIKNLGYEKQGHCHSFRKIHFYNKIENIHPDNSYEILRNVSQQECIDIFNKHKYFTCYDPLTFLMVISVLCGCIAIVYPVEGLDKNEWLKNTYIGEYSEKTKRHIYGIAYGNSKEEIEFAELTISLAKDQWENDISKFYKNHISSFIEDLKNFEFNLNTIENNYLKNPPDH
jgi:hypothetical protein